MASILRTKVLLQIANQKLLLCSLLRDSLGFTGLIYFGVIRSQYNIIYKELWYEYIYDEAMNAIEGHCWAGHWIYANFRRPVQTTEAKRLEKWHILQCSNFC